MSDFVSTDENGSDDDHIVDDDMWVDPPFDDFPGFWTTWKINRTDDLVVARTAAHYSNVDSLNEEMEGQLTSHVQKLKPTENGCTPCIDDTPGQPL